MYELFSSLKVA